MKVNNEMKVTIANGVMEKLDDLAAKRNKWQVQYDRTNHTLYELLDGCLDSYYAKHHLLKVMFIGLTQKTVLIG